MSIEPTGYCWKCGKDITETGLDGVPVVTSKLFCDKKCQNQYERMQARGIRRGKRAGYGAAGSTR